MEIEEVIKTLGLGSKFTVASKIEWISVKERLPTIKDADPETLCVLCWFVVNEGVAHSMYYWAIEGKPEITHWAYLNSPIFEGSKKNVPKK